MCLIFTSFLYRISLFSDDVLNTPVALALRASSTLVKGIVKIENQQAIYLLGPSFASFFQPMASYCCVASTGDANDFRTRVRLSSPTDSLKLPASKHQAKYGDANDGICT